MRIEGSGFDTPFSPSDVYTTQVGDTFQSIASMFQTTPENLAQYNNMQMDSTLQPGLNLQIPPQQAVQSVNSVGLPNLFSDEISPATTEGPIGTTSSALTTSYDIFTADDYSHHLKQTGERACGTTSLAMIFQHYGINMTPDQIDHEIRRANVGVAPERLVDFARSQGLNAEQYNNGSWDELKGMLDKGIPCMVQIDPDSPDNFNTHYVDVTGYKTDADGKQYVTISDPSSSTGPTQMPLEEFQKKWGHIHIEGTENGYNNFFIAIAPKGTSLPPSRVDTNAPASALDTAKSDVTNGWDRMTDPDTVGDEFHGAGEIVGSLFGFVGGGIGFGAWKLGSWINDWTEGIPVLENVAQPIGDLLQGAGEVVGDFGNMFDNVFCDVGNAAGDFVDHWGDAFSALGDGDIGGFFSNVGDSFGDVASGVADVAGDVVSGVGDAIGDAASAVGDAVSDFFSGW
jgi:hypothetical protein